MHIGLRCYMEIIKEIISIRNGFTLAFSCKVSTLPSRQPNGRPSEGKLVTEANELMPNKKGADVKWCFSFHLSASLDII